MGASGLSDTSSEHGAIRAEIERLHRERGEAWLRRDIDGYLSTYWDDAILFAVDERITVPVLWSRLRELVEAGGGPLELKLPPPADIVISDGADAVTTSYEWWARSRSEEGVDSGRTYFETNVWFRREGAWRIIRMHLTRLSLTAIPS